MRNAYAVLRERECAVGRVRREIEALRLVSHLLADQIDPRSVPYVSGVGSECHVEIASKQGNALEGGILRPVDDIEDDFAKIRARLVTAAGSDVKKLRVRNVLLQFRHVVVRVSQTFWRRVLGSRLWEPGCDLKSSGDGWGRAFL